MGEARTLDVRVFFSFFSFLPSCEPPLRFVILLHVKKQEKKMSDEATNNEKVQAGVMTWCGYSESDPCRNCRYAVLKSQDAIEKDGIFARRYLCMNLERREEAKKNALAALRADRYAEVFRLVSWLVETENASLLPCAETIIAPLCYIPLGEPQEPHVGNKAEEEAAASDILRIEAVVRYVEDGMVNDHRESEGVSLMPFMKLDDDGVGGTWTLDIDIDKGKIVGWPQGTTAKVHYKVCDWCGVRYHGNYVEDYVPSFLAIDDRGYGDYIILTISEDGLIKDWNPQQCHKELAEMFESKEEA